MMLAISRCFSPPDKQVVRCLEVKNADRWFGGAMMLIGCF